MTSPSEHPEGLPGDPQGGLRDDDTAPLPESLPAPLRAALAERTAGEAPRSPRDLELQAAVHRHFREAGAAADASARRRRRPFASRRLTLAVAAVAAVVFLAVQLPFLAGPGRAIDPADVDGDGRVDMLDAFALARGLADGRLLPARHDLDGDGTVDARDVDAVAQRAVALERPAGVEASS